MTNHRQSTDVPQSPSPPPPPSLPAPPAVSEVFRESFLAWFGRPEHQEAIRLLADLASDLISEGREYIDTPGTIWREVIMGAVLDLRQAAGQLRESARDIEDAGSGGREVVRVMLAIADAAAEVEPIAARLDAAFTVYLAAEPEGEGEGEE